MEIFYYLLGNAIYQIDRQSQYNVALSNLSILHQDWQKVRLPVFTVQNPRFVHKYGNLEVSYQKLVIQAIFEAYLHFQTPNFVKL
jgi:hypothetical protein